jgi:hypothetical protein
MMDEDLMQVLCYTGVIRYDDSNVGSAVKTFQVLSDGIIVFDLVSPPAKGWEYGTRLLGVAEQISPGEYKSPWIYLYDHLGNDMPEEYTPSARLVFRTSYPSSAEINVEGAWEDSDGGTYTFNEILQRV